MKRFILPALAAIALAVVPAVQLLASQNGAKVAALAIMKALSDSGWQVRDGAIAALAQGGT